MEHRQKTDVSSKPYSRCRVRSSADDEEILLGSRIKGKCPLGFSCHLMSSLSENEEGNSGGSALIEILASINCFSFRN
jgi:hypothetical protein